MPSPCASHRLQRMGRIVCGAYDGDQDAATSAFPFRRQNAARLASIVLANRAPDTPSMLPQMPPPSPAKGSLLKCAG